MTVIVQDNSPIHKSKEVRAFWSRWSKQGESEMPNLHLEYLPEYSPDYNLIELVWHSAKEYVAEIPFTDRSNSKKSPVLILWLDGNDAVVAVVTSATPRTQTDVLLQNWAKAGLRVASTVRLSRLDCLEQSLLLAKIGRVSVDDAQSLKEIWNSYIKLQF